MSNYSKILLVLKFKQLDKVKKLLSAHNVTIGFHYPNSLLLFYAEFIDITKTGDLIFRFDREVIYQNDAVSELYFEADGQVYSVEIVKKLYTPKDFREIEKLSYAEYNVFLGRTKEITEQQSSTQKQSVNSSDSFFIISRTKHPLVKLTD